MSYCKLHALTLAAATTAFMLTARPAVAQEVEPIPDGIEELALGAIKLMQQQNWPLANQYNEKAIKLHGSGAMESFGPLFGEIYYRDGFTKLKLKQYEEAIASFNKCYQEFPNKNGAISKNQFEKRALFQWAKAEMGLEEWQKALDLFAKFLTERDAKRDSFSPGDFFISRATCYYKLGQIMPGNDDFETALKNKVGYRVPDAAALNTFRILVEAAIEAENEQALLDFLAKNRGKIITDADEMYPYCGILLKLAGSALSADMERAAMQLYQLVPPAELALDLSRDKLQSLGNLPQLISPISSVTLDRVQLESRIASLEKQLTDPQSFEIVQLAAMAYIHEMAGNVRGAYTTYQQLEEFYPHAEKRESNLYNLARTSFMIDGGTDSLADATLFLKNFPNSKQAPMIKRLMFQSLFAEGRYEECIESATKMINQLEPGSKQHDACLHVLGGSYFYTGQYEEAAPYLERHVNEYPESEFKVAAAYFYAANPYRLMDYANAAKRLDEFIAKYPSREDNAFLPFAMFDRATCHYMLEESEQAKDLATKLINDHKDAQIIDQAYNLRGNAHVSLEMPKDAGRDFEAALQLAEKWRHEVVAGEAIFLLVDLTITEAGKDKEALKTAMPYIDTFWKEYAEGSPYSSRMAVLQVPVLESVGRLDEALDRLREIIAAMAKDSEGGGLEKVLPHYTDAYLTAHSPEELRDHYYKFPGIPIDAKAARALLRIEIIKTYQSVKKKAQSDAKKKEAQIIVDNLFKELKNDFNVNDLSTSILMKLGNYLRTKTATPFEALTFYDEVIKRDVEKYRFEARVGRGEIYGKSPRKTDLDKATADFQYVLKSTEEKKLKERALFNLIQLSLAKEDYAGTAEMAKAFLDKDTGYNRSESAPLVHLYLGRSYEKRGDSDDALRTYARVWGAYMGSIEASAPAMKSWMELLWKRNNPATEKVMSDRQGAYEGGWRFIQQTQGFKDKMTEGDRKLWDEVEVLVRQYGANPKVKAK